MDEPELCAACGLFVGCGEASFANGADAVAMLGLLAVRLPAVRLKDSHYRSPVAAKARHVCIRYYTNQAVSRNNAINEF